MLRNYVESMLNHEPRQPEYDLDHGTSARERYEKHVVKRLLTAFDLYEKSELFQDDFLLALEK